MKCATLRFWIIPVRYQPAQWILFQIAISNNVLLKYEIDNLKQNFNEIWDFNLTWDYFVEWDSNVHVDCNNKCQIVWKVIWNMRDLGMILWLVSKIDTQFITLFAQWDEEVFLMRDLSPLSSSECYMLYTKWSKFWCGVLSCWLISEISSPITRIQKLHTRI